LSGRTRGRYPRRVGTATSCAMRLRTASARVAAALRATDRYVRLRAAIVAGWVAVGVVTAVLACPPSGAGNALGAEARVLSEAFVGGAQVLVRNDSSHVWRDLVVTVDGGWRYEHPTLRPHDQIVVPASRFRRGDEALAPDHRPRRVAVECDRGRYELEVR
jgi:hypothetical protein